MVGENNPLVPGDVAVLFLIGLGEVTPPLEAGVGAGDGGAAGPLNRVSGVTATVGGEAAAVLFQGLTPYLVGLYQLNIQIAETLATGDHELVVMLDGVTAQTGVTLPVLAGE